MISSMLEPASRFSKTVATGIRVLRNTHAPLRLPATLSTAGHCDQSRAAMFEPSFYGSRLYGFLPRIWQRAKRGRGGEHRLCGGLSSRLRKNSISCGFWEGHEFHLCRKFRNIKAASSRWGKLLTPEEFFRGLLGFPAGGHGLRGLAFGHAR